MESRRRSQEAAARELAFWESLRDEAIGPSRELYGLSDENNHRLKVIKSVLTDPRAVQFENVYTSVYTSESSDQVCGKLNARNKMGGYVGFKPFFVSEYDAAILGEENQDIEKDMKDFLKKSTGHGTTPTMPGCICKSAPEYCNVVWETLNGPVFSDRDQIRIGS